MKKNKYLLMLTIVIIILSSCATSAKVLYRLSIGDNKATVVASIGEPNAVRGSIKNNYGQIIDVWEYRLYMYEGAIEGLSPYYNLYWLYFVEGKLYQWGQAGDWEREADRIIEFRFK